MQIQNMQHKNFFQRTTVFLYALCLSTNLKAFVSGGIILTAISELPTIKVSDVISGILLVVSKALLGGITNYCFKIYLDRKKTKTSDEG